MTAVPQPSKSEEQLVRDARAGLLDTYLCLALAVPNTEVEWTEEMLLVQGPHDLAFCNFAAALNFPSRSRFEQSLARLSGLSHVQTLYHTSGDEPSDASLLLDELGWERRLDLIVMAWRPGEPKAATWWEPDREPAPSQDRLGRLAVAAFMTEMFFSSGHRDIKQSIVRATAASPHLLCAVEEESHMCGAVMISQHAETVGLYNLCVEHSRRRKGIGARLVRYCQEVAEERSVPLVLQCSPLLMGFYTQFGFRHIGSLQSWGPPAVEWAD